MLASATWRFFATLLKSMNLFEKNCTLKPKCWDFQIPEEISTGHVVMCQNPH